MSYNCDMCFQSVSNWIESSESCRFHSIRWNSLGDFTEDFHGGRFFLNLFFTISSRLAFKACISSSKSQSTTKRHQANAMYIPLRSRYIMILSEPPFATDTEVQSNRTVICGLATSPHGPPFLHRNQSMWKSHQITSKSFLCSFAGSKSSSWQFAFPTSLGKIFCQCQKITQCCFQQRGDLPCLAAEFLLVCLKFFLRKKREKRRCSARCHVTGGIGGPVDRAFRPAWHPTDRREPQWIVGPSTFKESSRSHLKKKQLTAIWQLKKSQDKSSETNEEHSKQQILSKHIYDSLRCWPAVTGPTSSEATKTIRPRSRGDRCGSQSSTVSTPPWAATRDLEKMEKMGKRQRTSIGRS